jgi:rhodanese-related sulfurtransferase
MVYCSNESCIASQVAYRILAGNGYKNIRRYAGGLVDWEEAGYPLAGTGI